MLAHFEAPLFLAGGGIHGVEVAAITAKIDHSFGQNCGRAHCIPDFIAPFLLAGLSIEHIQIFVVTADIDHPGHLNRRG